MKKIVSVFIIFTLLFSFSSCGTENPSDFPTSSESEGSPISENKETSNSEETIVTVSLPGCFSEYRKGVVKRSNFDTDGDLAENAVEFTEKYLSKTYSEDSEIESFEITDIEIDMNTTDYNINIYYNGDDYKNDDLINSFVVVRYRCDIKVYDGIEYPRIFTDRDPNEPIEGHLYLMYDPGDIYAVGYELDGYFWKVVNSNPWDWNDKIHSDEEIFENIYARNNPDVFPLHTDIEENSEDTAAAVDCLKEYLESGLKNDPAVLGYEILKIEPDINHTNFYINTVQQTDFSLSSLLNGVICLNVSYVMDIDENAEKLGEFSAPFGEYDNVPVEYNYYLVRNYDEWEVFGGSTYPHDAFDDLTDEKIIEAINSLS